MKAKGSRLSPFMMKTFRRLTCWHLLTTISHRYWEIMRENVENPFRLLLNVDRGHKVFRIKRAQPFSFPSARSAFSRRINVSSP
jgi:hypothetical protein